MENIPYLSLLAFVIREELNNFAEVTRFYNLQGSHLPFGLHEIFWLRSSSIEDCGNMFPVMLLRTFTGWHILGNVEINSYKFLLTKAKVLNRIKNRYVNMLEVSFL